MVDSTLTILILASLCQFNASYAQSRGGDQCLDLLKEYKNYWIKDSSGKNGFRELLADKFLRDCKFSGMKWSTISAYLGKANFTFSHSSETHYRYRLNNYTDDLAAPGNMFLEIFVSKGIITSFKIDTVDG